MTNTTFFARAGSTGIWIVLALWLGGCGRVVSAGGSVGGAVPPSFDGQGRPGRPQPPIGERVGQRGPADGLVSGRITAPEGSQYESLIVELFELPARVVHSVRAWVDEEYSIVYAIDLVNCRELAVRFLIPGENTTPYVRHLGGCGRHVVNYEFAREE